MALLDNLVDQINDDLRDCLVPVRDRFRFALSTIFDYAVANPAQGNASTAQSAIGSTFTGTYADGLVSPGISIDTFTQAFLTRHGVGANANQRWVSVRDFLVARGQHKGKVIKAYEDGTLLPLPDLWIESLTQDDPPADITSTESRAGNQRFIEYSSVTRGITVREIITHTVHETPHHYVETVRTSEII